MQTWDNLDHCFTANKRSFSEFAGKQYFFYLDMRKFQIDYSCLRINLLLEIKSDNRTCF